MRKLSRRRQPFGSACFPVVVALTTPLICVRKRGADARRRQAHQDRAPDVDRSRFKGGTRLMKAIIWTTLAAATALSAAQTSARAAGEPYLVGLIAGTTGAYGSTGVATVNGAQMAADKINASGRVRGRPLQLDPHNDDASA